MAVTIIRRKYAPVHADDVNPVKDDSADVGKPKVLELVPAPVTDGPAPEVEQRPDIDQQLDTVERRYTAKRPLTIDKAPASGARADDPLMAGTAATDPAITETGPAAAMPAPLREITTLAHVLDLLGTARLNPGVLRDIRWAVNALCNSLGVAPIDLPADVAALREHLDRLSPAMMGIEPAAFGNIKSHIRRALRLAGKAARPRARNVPLAEPWNALYQRLPKAGKAGVGSFVTFASEAGWLPGEIGEEHLIRFVHVLQTSSLHSNCHAVVVNTVREWNRAGESVEGWPQFRLSVPGGKVEAYSLPWEELPAPFRLDAENCLAYLADPPLDDDDAPIKALRSSTLEARKFVIRQTVSILLKHGWRAEDVTGLADLYTPRALDVILGFFEPGEDGAGLKRRIAIAISLKMIDKYWVKCGPEVQKRLTRDIARHAPRAKTRGMVKKNRAKVALLKDDRVAARYLHLPPRLFAELEKIERPTERDANLALAALYMELTQMWPVRVGNMSAVHLQKNVIRTGKGAEARVFIHFDAADVKNDTDLEAELPPTAVRLLDLYIRKYRPLLIHEPSTYLFPAKHGGPRSTRTMWGTITKVTERYIGVRINPHLFRHIAGLLHLRARPGEHEVMRRVWGHASIDTGRNNYLGEETDSAVRQYDRQVLHLREQTQSLVGRGRYRRR